MALVLVDNGEKVALEYLVNKVTAQEDLTLKLFTSNTTPTDTHTVTDYTEATGNGYSSKSLTGASWTVSGTNPTTASYAEQTFSFTGALGNTYGYYVIRTSTGDLLWAERFTDGPYNIQNNGDQIKVTLNITMS